MNVPTLVLIGGDSSPGIRATVEMVAAALPNGRIEEIPGEQHTAHRDAPDLLASKIIAFVSSPG